MKKKYWWVLDPILTNTFFSYGKVDFITFKIIHIWMNFLDFWIGFFFDIVPCTTWFLTFFLYLKKWRICSISSRVSSKLRGANSHLAIIRRTLEMCFIGGLRILDFNAKVIVHYDTSAMKRFLTSVSLQHEPKASDVITLAKKTFFARVSYEILYHEVWKRGFPHAKRA